MKPSHPVKIHKNLDHIRLIKAASGGFIAEHHFKEPPARKGIQAWSGRPEHETHALKSLGAVTAHIKQHMGGEPAEHAATPEPVEE